MAHPLGFLIGTWEGEGTGIYPSIAPFSYREVLEITLSPKGFLTHGQRTWAADDDRPLHAEVGYWRSPMIGRAELALAHPTGVTEVCEGTVHDDLDGTSVHLRSVAVSCTPTAKQVESLERWYRVTGDVLSHRLSMGAVGLGHQPHLEATLQRIG